MWLKKQNKLKLKLKCEQKYKIFKGIYRLKKKIKKNNKKKCQAMKISALFQYF